LSVRIAVMKAWKELYEGAQPMASRNASVSGNPKMSSGTSESASSSVLYGTVRARPDVPIHVPSRSRNCIEHLGRQYGRPPTVLERTERPRVDRVEHVGRTARPFGLDLIHQFGRSVVPWPDRQVGVEILDEADQLTDERFAATGVKGQLPAQIGQFRHRHAGDRSFAERRPSGADLADDAVGPVTTVVPVPVARTARWSAEQPVTARNRRQSSGAAQTEDAPTGAPVVIHG
jgi:hypothetical protein